MNNIFKHHTKTEAGRLILDLFLFFKKAIYKGKTSDQHLSVNIFRKTSTWTYNKNKLYNISGS